MRRTGLDLPSLVAGAVLLGFGGVLLADGLDLLALTFAWLAPIACTAVGAILLAVGLGRAPIAPAEHTAPALGPGERGRTLERPAERLVAGVAAGLAVRFGVDALWVRIGFAAATVAGGFGLPFYVLGWVLMPPAADARSRRLRTGRGAVEVSLGAGLLVVAALLTVRATGVLWFSDAFAWPVALLVAGGALIWRTSQQGAARTDPPAPAKPRAQPVSSPAAPEVRTTAHDAPAAETPERIGAAAAAVSRTGLGGVLILAAAFVFLESTGTLGAVRDVVVVTLVVAVAIGVILAPWFVRLARSLTAERAERIRSQERAEVAAHLHDSVLQTLALVQKRAGDPRAVAALARSQERELRAWLSGRTVVAGDEPRTLRSALEAAAGEVERAHGVVVEVVAVGDLDLDDHVAALVAAAREAMVNAAKHAGAADESISVFAEVREGGQAEVFVRDRGRGFAPAEVPADRRGIAESIVGRMARHGGRARISSVPGEGTEVELTL